MSLSLGEERMEAVKKELDEVIKFYRELQKISLPAKIIMISDAAEGATERFVPKLNAQLLKKWNQRANNVKKDNENFANFEFGVCETMAASGASVVFKEVHKLYRKLEWIVNHTAEIIALILETLQIAGESEKTDELWQDIKGAFVSIFTGDWSMAVKEAEATNSLADQGVDVFTMHVDGPKVVVETAAKRGKMVCGYHASQAKLAPNAYLTGAEWNWLTAYKTVIDAAKSGKPHPNFIRGGLKEGYVKMSAYGSMVTDAAKKNADDIKSRMVAGSFDIFKGPLKDNKGKEVIPAGKALKQTDLTLEGMNYLVEGVVGSI